MKYQSFKEWHDEADIPTRNEKGVWVDLEDGSYWMHPDNWLPPAKAKHPLSKRDVASVFAIAERNVEHSRFVLERLTDEALIALFKKVLVDGERLIARKSATKTKLIEWIVEYDAAHAAEVAARKAP